MLESRCLALRAALLLLVAACASAPSTPPPAERQPLADAAQTLGLDRPRTRVLVLGTFHFANPGLDVHRPATAVDMLSPERQVEVVELVSQLARFRPTKIAVEVEVEGQAELERRYRAYLAGERPLTVNEVEQVGFRLAERAHLERLEAVDAQPGSFFQPIFESVEARESELPEVDADWQERYKRLYAYDDSLVRRQSLIDHLLYMNHPERLRMSHGSYTVGWFKLDGPDGPLGADFRAAWFDRNLRIFRNLQKITAGPGDRLLLVVGAGHVPILRFLLESSPEYDWVELADYLAPDAAKRRPAR